MDAFTEMKNKRDQLMRRMKLDSKHIGKDTNDAQKLTDFFQALKSNDNNFFDSVTYEILKKDILQTRKSFASFFTKRGGVAFEKELDTLLLRLTKSLTQQNLDKGTFQVGQLPNATTQITKQYYESIKRQARTSKEFDNLRTSSKYSKYFLAAKQQKVDIDMSQSKMNIEITSSPSQYLLDIYSLLQKCHFQAKNYAKLTWKSQLWRGSYHIHFGNSSYRFFANTLHYLQTPKREVDKLYFYSLDNYKENTELRRIIWQFKQIYEITGIGSIDIKTGKLLNTVNYIIFNAPDSDFITVKSARELLAEILESPWIPADPFTTEVAVRKELFGWVDQT